MCFINMLVMACLPFLFVACLAASTTSQYPHHSNNLEDVRIYNKDAYDYQERGRPLVEVLNVTSSSIHINWSLPEMKFNDGVLESSRVVCETSKGFMLSKKNVTSQAGYRCENLYANTRYLVCVYMLEKSNSSNTKVLHFSCHKFQTHTTEISPSMRTDSIVAVVFTLGYIVAMIVIGYATWRWKRKMKEQDEAKQKFAIEDDDYEEDDGMLNGGLRDTKHSRDTGGGGGVGVSGACGRGSGTGRVWRGDPVGIDNDTRSSNPRLTNSDRVSGGSRGNNVGSANFCDSDVVLERKPNSVEEVNGCLELKRNSRGSAAKLTDLSENGNSSEKKRPNKSQSVEDSPVKVTEITF